MTYAFTNQAYKNELLRRLDELLEWNKTSEAPAKIKQQYNDYLIETRTKIHNYSNAVPETVSVRETVLTNIGEDLMKQKQIADQL